MAEVDILSVGEGSVVGEQVRRERRGRRVLRCRLDTLGARTSARLLCIPSSPQAFFMGHTVENRRVKLRPVRWAGGTCGRQRQEEGERMT